DGCAALAKTSRLCMRAPAAMEASSMVRRVSMVLSLFVLRLLVARLGRDNSRVWGRRPRCAGPCCIAGGDCSGGQVVSVLGPEPSVELLRQRLAPEIPHGGIGPVQQARQQDVAAVENGHDIAIRGHCRGEILLVDLDQHAQATAGS